MKKMAILLVLSLTLSIKSFGSSAFGRGDGPLTVVIDDPSVAKLMFDRLTEAEKSSGCNVNNSTELCVRKGSNITCIFDPKSSGHKYEWWVPNKGYFSCVYEIDSQGGVTNNFDISR